MQKRTIILEFCLEQKEALSLQSRAFYDEPSLENAFDN